MLPVREVEQVAGIDCLISELRESISNQQIWAAERYQAMPQPCTFRVIDMGLNGLRLRRNIFQERGHCHGLLMTSILAKRQAQAGPAGSAFRADTEGIAYQSA